MRKFWLGLIVFSEEAKEKEKTIDDFSRCSCGGVVPGHFSHNSPTLQVEKSSIVFSF